MISCFLCSRSEGGPAGRGAALTPEEEVPTVLLAAAEVDGDALSGMSIRELIRELAQIEDRRGRSHADVERTRRLEDAIIVALRRRGRPQAEDTAA